jgi:hypothetical protein
MRYRSENIDTITRELSNFGAFKPRRYSDFLHTEGISQVIYGLYPRCFLKLFYSFIIIVVLHVRMAVSGQRVRAGRLLT